MIAQDDLDAILAKTVAFWEEQVHDEAFIAICAGKEIGHRVADYVDETTVSFLKRHFRTGSELDGKGKVRPRSMGDIWLLSNGMYNPVNVKAGLHGSGGQPNLVSLTKLVNGLLAHEIDSYYLLFMKTEVRQDGLVPHVRLIDMLDYLEFVSFDAGPGQAMLQETKFFKQSSGYRPPDLTVSQKLDRCFELLEDGDRRLIENRHRKMQKMRVALDVYRKVGDQPVTQGGLNIG